MMSSLKSKKGFWATLKRPILTLAPMADVADSAFRQIIAARGKPDLFMTEFVSVAGLCSRGRENLLQDLTFEESERPIVAQFFGNKPDNFREAASLAVELGFDGIDINMGCPIKVVCKTGSGAALIENPDIAQEIIQATIDGAGELPVSVKTRIGSSGIAIEEWTSKLLEAHPVALTLHLRTRKEMSKVPAHWDLISRVVALARASDVLILGNGDVKSTEHARQLAAETGVDGVMLGRAIFGNPWLFSGRDPADISLEERLDTMLEHACLYESIFQNRKFVRMRKHLMAYVSGFSGARELRRSLEQVSSVADLRLALKLFHKTTWATATV